MSTRITLTSGKVQFDKAAVERAAKAICETVNCHTWAGSEKFVKDEYRKDARVVIAALNGESA